jgi:hypothetical protein
MTSAQMAAWFATLPQTPPATPGQLWNDGGLVAFTLPPQPLMLKEDNAGVWILESGVDDWVWG